MRNFQNSASAPGLTKRAACVILATGGSAATGAQRPFCGYVQFPNSAIPAECGYGGIGRRIRFRILRRTACRFDPCYPHQKSANIIRYLPIFTSSLFTFHFSLFTPRFSLLTAPTKQRGIVNKAKLRHCIFRKNANAAAYAEENAPAIAEKAEEYERG